MQSTKQTIESRKEISLLVRSFYEKVRKDEMLGPIFNGMIHDWEKHLERLTDFWEGNLLYFIKTNYAGDPKTVHQQVDDAMGNSITMNHFGHWINLWIETIDEQFTGDNAQRAKMMARKMATFFFLKIHENRLKRNVLPSQNNTSAS